MRWKSVFGLGALMWLLPFVIAFLVFPFRESARPLFESVMAVAVSGMAVLLGLRYIRGGIGRGQGLVLGGVWLMMSMLIDAPLMLLGGPMQMTPGQYFMDIGLTYAAIPLITWGLAAAYGTGLRHAGKPRGS